MKSPKSLYSVTGSIGINKIKAHVMLDKKNNSVHMHFYGDVFDTAQKSIVVKHADTRFPEGEGVDLVKRIVLDEFSPKKVQIKDVTLETGFSELTPPARRTIIRFKK
jgi:hypothetical protein